MKKFILILILGLLTFGLGVSGVRAANRGGELNGSEIGGRKIVSVAKSVKEVMDVYDKMELKNLITDRAPGRWISGVAKEQNGYQDGDDIILRKRPGRTKYSNIILKGKGSDVNVEEIELAVEKIER